MRKSIRGFTIVELLVVIVVIAVLAAISVVAYTNIQNRAYNSAVESDIAVIIKKMELAKADVGHYPRNISEFPEFTLSKQVYAITANNIYYCNDSVNDRYAIGLRSKSGRGYIANNEGVTAGITVHSVSTCSAIGITWGNDATKFSTQGWFADTTPPRWSTTWSWVK